MFNKVKPGGIMDKTLSNLTSLGKGIGKQAIEEPKKIVQTAISQASTLESVEKQNAGKEEKEKNGQGLETANNNSQRDSGQARMTEKNKSSVQVGLKEQVMGTQKDENTVDFLKQMYSPSTTNNEKQITNNHIENPLETARILSSADPNANKSPQDLQKMQALRKLLHKDYVDRTFNRRPPARPEEAQKEQETQAQRMERLHQEDLQKKRIDEEKKKPIAVVQAANKTESRPGAG